MKPLSDAQGQWSALCLDTFQSILNTNTNTNTNTKVQMQAHETFVWDWEALHCVDSSAPQYMLTLFQKMTHQWEFLYGNLCIATLCYAFHDVHGVMCRVHFVYTVYYQVHIVYFQVHIMYTVYFQVYSAAAGCCNDMIVGGISEPMLFDWLLTDHWTDSPA